MRRIKLGIFQSCEYPCLLKITLEVHLCNSSNDLAEQMKAEIGVLKLCSYWEIRLGEGDIFPDILSSFRKRTRVIIFEACIMEEQVSDGCVSFFVDIVVEDILGDRI